METYAAYTIHQGNPRQRTPLPPAGFRDWTIKKRVLWLLRDAARHGDGWIMIDAFFDHKLYTYRNRISELRLHDGFDIKPENHPVYGWRYRLNEAPQGRLEI